MSRFRLSPEARHDLREILAYIGGDSIDVAERVRQELLSNCRRLAQNPRVGHLRVDLTSREDVLFWPVYSYLIVYRPGTRPLDILRVLHGKRNVRRILG